VPSSSFTGTVPLYHRRPAVSQLNSPHRLCAKKVSSTLFWSLISALPATVAQIPPPSEDTITSSDSLHFYTHLGESLSNLLSLHLDVITETLKALEDYQALKVTITLLLSTHWGSSSQQSPNIRNSNKILNSSLRSNLSLKSLRKSALIPRGDWPRL
jgi:hypothetical protein